MIFSDPIIAPRSSCVWTLSLFWWANLSGLWISANQILAHGAYQILSLITDLPKLAILQGSCGQDGLQFAVVINSPEISVI